MEARQMRQKAHQSNAPQQAPAHLREAEQIMLRAEAEHESDARSDEVRHYSHLASAKFEAAIAEARRRDALQREEVAHRRFFTEQARLRRDAKAQVSQLQTDYNHIKSLLDSTQAELDAVQQKMADQSSMEMSEIEELRKQRMALDEQVKGLETQRLALEAQLADRDAKLEVEREARADAENLAKLAMEKLQEVASVREDEQGTIITLTGEVLFASGESVLLPTARERLKLVADALKAQDEKVGIMVEGHTDTQGSSRMNEQLSDARAAAVKRYLIEEGVSEDRIKSIGRGEKEPVATNRTPEGRANNRRVEIILNEET
jgi:outer membrane protein OmpA-like peptidoglycan-associated protein